VVDSPVDNILAQFGSVVDAVECDVKIQEALKAKNEELPDDRWMESPVLRGRRGTSIGIVESFQDWMDI
jgi:hypothetical protein